MSYYPPHYHEPHSADGRTYIEKLAWHNWKVVWRGIHMATWRYRRQARVHIHALKNGECF